MLSISLQTSANSTRSRAKPDGSDPAELVASGSSPHLVDALEQARPLSSVLIDERLANLPPVEAALAAAPVIAAQAVDAWEPAVQTVAERINVDADVIRSSVAAFIRAWNNDPARLADQQLGLTTQVQDRLTAAANAHRWERLASRIDPRLLADTHWLTLASALHDAHARRVDVRDAITVALEDGPLNPDAPAADLTSRLARLTEPERSQKARPNSSRHLSMTPRPPSCPAATGDPLLGEPVLSSRGGGPNGATS